jgi:hypothetical protein
MGSIDWGIFAYSTLVLAVLIACYVFGIWARTYVFPAEASLTLTQQLVAGLPVALITMGIYAKNAVPQMATPFDFAIACGYAMVLGMLSRESLARILQGSKDSVLPTPHGKSETDLAHSHS